MHGEVLEGAGGDGGFAAGGAAAPLCVTFGSDAAAREAALLGRVEVPRAGGGPPWQVGLFFKGASLGQPPLVLPGEPWDVCAGGREEQGGGSVVRLMAAFGARHPGDAALREEVGDALREHARPATLHFVCLLPPEEELRRRVRERSHEFMPATLLDSQLEAFEPPAASGSDAAILVAGAEALQPPEAIADAVARKLQGLC